MPVLYALRDCGKPLSIDTYKPDVMREAIAAGADMINDINGFRAEGALRAVKDSDCALCIMHMQRDPSTMQVNPEYQNVLDEVTSFLRGQVMALEQGGVPQLQLPLAEIEFLLPPLAVEFDEFLCRSICWIQQTGP